MSGVCIAPPVPWGQFAWVTRFLGLSSGQNLALALAIYFHQNQNRGKATPISSVEKGNSIESLDTRLGML